LNTVNEDAEVPLAGRLFRDHAAIKGNERAESHLQHGQLLARAAT